MSGGSYEYLCYKEGRELFDHQGNLDAMVSRLAGLGYAKDAAEESARILAELRAIEVRLTVAVQRLQPIWRAVEWWDSGDSGEEAVERALAVYRGEEVTV